MKAVMFRFRKKIGVSYQKQGYIYFKSHRYHKLSAAERLEIDELCILAGGEYEKALKRFVTTDKSVQQVCNECYVSKATLDRCVSKYIKLFAKRL